MHESDVAVEKLKEALAILLSYKEKLQDSNMGMKNADLAIADIMHELEFTEFPPEKGHELALELKKLRKERRAVKEDQTIFMMLKGFCDKNSTVISRLQETVERMDNEIEGRKLRLYTPRIRSEQMSIIYSEGEQQQEIAVINDSHLEPTTMEEVIYNHN